MSSPLSLRIVVLQHERETGLGATARPLVLGRSLLAVLLGAYWFAAAIDAG